MVYHVPESKKSIGQNLFEFDLPAGTPGVPDGTVYALPKAKYLEVGVIEKLAENPKDLTITDLLDVLGRSDEVAQAIRKLDIEQLMDLMKAWQEDSGLSLGES